MILIGFASAFSPNLAVYIVLRFLIGFFITGNIVYPFVLISEYVGPKRRSLAGMTIWFAASLSIILLGSIAPFVRTWKMLTIWSTAPFVLTFAFFKWVKVARLFMERVRVSLSMYHFIEINCYFCEHLEGVENIVSSTVCPCVCFLQGSTIC